MRNFEERVCDKCGSPGLILNTYDNGEIVPALHCTDFTCRFNANLDWDFKELEKIEQQSL